MVALTKIPRPSSARFGGFQRISSVNEPLCEKVPSPRREERWPSEQLIRDGERGRGEGHGGEPEHTPSIAIAKQNRTNRIASEGSRPIQKSTSHDSFGRPPTTSADSCSAPHPCPSPRRGSCFAVAECPCDGERGPCRERATIEGSFIPIKQASSRSAARNDSAGYSRPPILRSTSRTGRATQCIHPGSDDPAQSLSFGTMTE